MSGYGVKLVAAVAISAAGLGSGAHLVHLALSPVPALMMTWPRPRQCLQVFEAFISPRYVVGFSLFHDCRCRRLARCRRCLPHGLPLRLTRKIERLGIAENGRLNALAALVFRGRFCDSVRVAVLILAVSVFAHLKIEIEFAVGVPLDA